MKEETVIHPIPPVFDEHSRILILGSFPSVKSRESAFFYGHPQNRFWRVLATLFEDNVPGTVDEKRIFLLKKRIAVWDVIAKCRITGSADTTIREAEPNDLSSILSAAPIEKIFTNGGTATALYRRHIREKVGMDCIPLPSTSPANAACSLDGLLLAWRKIIQ